MTPRHQQPEAVLQKAIVGYLALVAPRGRRNAPFMWLSIPNESRRSARQGAQLKAMGMLPGAADLMFVAGGRVAFVELKVPGRYQTRTQKAFEAECKHHGVPYIVARSLAEVEALLADQGWLRP